jgi:hypothetical protein
MISAFSDFLAFLGAVYTLTIITANASSVIATPMKMMLIISYLAS